MRFLRSAGSVLACGLALVAISAPANAAVVYDWALSGPSAALGGFPLLGSGTITADPSSGNAWTVTGITGTIGGSAITGLTNYFVSDNLVYPTGTSFLDTDGIAFTTTSGMDVNIFSFFGEGSTPSGNADGEETSGAGFGVGTFKAVPAPEPFTLSVFGAGLAGAAALRRRKKAQKA